MHYNKTSAAYLQSKTASSSLKKISYIALSALLAIAESLRNCAYFLFNCIIAPINWVYRPHTPEMRVDAQKVEKQMSTEEAKEMVENLNKQLREHHEKQAAKIKELDDECNELNDECDERLENYNQLVDQYNRLKGAYGQLKKDSAELLVWCEEGEDLIEELSIVEENQEQQIYHHRGVWASLVTSLIAYSVLTLGYSAVPAITVPAAVATGTATYLLNRVVPV